MREKLSPIKFNSILIQNRPELETNFLPLNFNGLHNKIEEKENLEARYRRIAIYRGVASFGRIQNIFGVFNILVNNNFDCRLSCH